MLIRVEDIVRWVRILEDFALFVSGGRCSIQLSYSRRASARAPHPRAPAQMESAPFCAVRPDLMDSV